MIVTIAGTALAIRMDLFSPADLPEAIRTTRALANDLKFVAGKVTGPSAELKAYGLFGQFLLDVLKPQLVTAAEDERPSLVAAEISSTDAEAKMVRGVSKETVDAWGANALGRFCAEPKGYFYSRNTLVWATRTPVYVSGKPMPLGSIAETNQFGVLRGQLAFWYNTTTGADFNKSPFRARWNIDARRRGRTLQWRIHAALLILRGAIGPHDARPSPFDRRSGTRCLSVDAGKRTGDIRISA